MKTLLVEPLKNTEQQIKQPDEYAYIPSIPNRICILAQSNSGKTVLIINMLKKVYLKLYDDIYIISHSINLDKNWDSIRGDIPDENLKDEYEEADLKKIIDRHLKIREKQREAKKRKLGQLLIVLDDVIDNKDVISSKMDSLLTTLFIRGRHLGISVWFSSQKYKTAIPRIIRLNCSHYIIFRLSQKSEREAILEEFSALVPMNVLNQIYDDATDERFSFLYIDRTQHNKNKIFHKKFDEVYEIE